MPTPIPGPDGPRALFGLQTAYRPTPLRDIRLAGGLEVLVKDESGRLGLGSFKALGGGYAVARLIQSRWLERFGTPISDQELRSAPVRSFASELTFICASAGNHGMAVAAAAALYGAGCRVHIAAPVPETFARRLRAQDAQVVRSGAVYEESLDAAVSDARDSGGELLSDTSESATDPVSALVIEGYTLLVDELRATFAEAKRWPTHVFVQAGVGGLAAACAHWIRAAWSTQPELIVVEPDAAPCLQQSAQSGDMVTVEGPVSNMGRLDCKRPSRLAFEILEASAVDYQTVSDTEASAAMEVLASAGISTTPSGAAGLAAVISRFGSAVARGALPLIIVTEGPA